ncbi:transmembrane protein, putative [Medicago truncatula]|uniref:Transmembrane protein, putative n=1 Tax=Medicago truncatula TaxID=3880 RepID=G7IPA3_MEDTR|nr:transmembrane protein, putative [Medicago truncatula]
MVGDSHPPVVLVVVVVCGCCHGVGWRYFISHIRFSRRFSFSFRPSLDIGTFMNSFLHFDLVLVGVCYWFAPEVCSYSGVGGSLLTPAVLWWVVLVDSVAPAVLAFSPFCLRCLVVVEGLVCKRFVFAVAVINIPSNSLWGMIVVVVLFVLFGSCVFVPCFFLGEGLVLVSRWFLVIVPSSLSSKLLCAFPTSPSSSVFSRQCSLGLQRVVQLWWILYLDGWRFSPPRRKTVQWGPEGGAKTMFVAVLVVVDFVACFWFVFVRAGSICAIFSSFLSYEFGI